MDYYQICVANTTNNNDCPFILDTFNPQNKKDYILIKTHTRNLKQEERDELEKMYKICKTVGYVHIYKAYDVISSKKYLVDDRKNDPLTRKKPSSNILKKINWKFNNRKYIKSYYDKDKLFTTFCLYYSNDLLHFSNNINQIIINYLITSDDINEMKCNLSLTDFNCFVNCKREDTTNLLQNCSWLLRPSKIDSFDFYKNNDELLPCSQYYALSLKKKNIEHHLIEHSFGEGYYSCSGSYDKNGIPTVKRNLWFGSFVYILENLIKNNNISILDYYKN